MSLRPWNSAHAAAACSSDICETVREDKIMVSETQCLKHSYNEMKASKEIVRNEVTPTVFWDMMV
jgi:hypothetical protein